MIFIFLVAFLFAKNNLEYHMHPERLRIIHFGVFLLNKTLHHEKYKGISAVSKIKFGLNVADG